MCLLKVITNILAAVYDFGCTESVHEQANSPRCQLAPAEHQKYHSKKKSSAFWQYPTDVGNKHLADALMVMALYSNTIKN
jgi:hypothetical protein